MAELLAQASNVKARLLLCHGAGAPVQSDFCLQLASALAVVDIEVWGFNFAYMQQSLMGKKRPPPKLPQLQQELFTQLKSLPMDLPLLLGGKSMGGRVISGFVTDNAAQVPDQVLGLCCYGYPFHPPKKDSWRTGHFGQLQLPVLIVQGERDPFGSKAELAGHSWPAIDLQWLTGADHDFKALKSSGQTQQQLIQQAARLTRGFVDGLVLENK